MATKAFLFLFVFIGATGGLAQQHLSDSLSVALKVAPNDTSRVHLLIEAARTLREKDNNRALNFAHEAVALADTLDYDRGLAFALEHYAWMLYRKGDYSQSLQVSTRALVISRDLGEQALEAKCLINVAAIHYEQMQFEAAIDHFNRAFSVAERIGELTVMARCYNNIAYTYVGLGQTDSAFTYARKALLASKEAKEPYLRAFAMRTLGDIDLLRNNPDQALAHFEQCLELSIRENNTFLKASVLHRLGKTYKNLGDTDKAIQYLRENIAIAEAYGFKDELERAYKMTAETYYAGNDPHAAYRYQSKYIDLHDSLYNQRSSEEIALMQTRFATEIKQAQIELLTKEAERQRDWLYFYGTGLALFVILAVVLLVHNRSSRRANVLLQEKNREIERQTRQLINVNTTKDKLFSIISHDLRSPVASLRALMELIAKAGVTQEEFANLTEALKRNLDSVYDDLDNLLLWAQTQLNGLQATPEAVAVRRLADEKIALFREAAQRKRVKIVNEIDAGAVVLADRNHVGLVLRNLIANAIKFNHPGGRIELRSQPCDNHYEFSIIDSGIGIAAHDLERLFNAETHFTRPGTEKEKGAGIGLLLTKEFIETNGGRIWVTSEVGKGTTFTFTLKEARVAVLN